MMQPPLPPPTDYTWLYWTIAVVALIVIFFLWLVIAKNRRRRGEHVFGSSRLSRGNRIFPAQVVITPASITLYHPQWIGRLEKSIHMAHVASIKIDTNLIFSDVLIETTGGQNPIVCHGHLKGDAIEMKRLIETYQTEYYRK